MAALDAAIAFTSSMSDSVTRSPNIHVYVGREEITHHDEGVVVVERREGAV
jgi:hypothetical protein